MSGYPPVVLHSAQTFEHAVRKVRKARKVRKVMLGSLQAGALLSWNDHGRLQDQALNLVLPRRKVLLGALT